MMDAIIQYLKLTDLCEKKIEIKNDIDREITEIKNQIEHLRKEIADYGLRGYNKFYDLEDGRVMFVNYNGGITIQKFENKK